MVLLLRFMFEPLISILLQHNCRTCRNIEFEPLLLVVDIKRIIVRRVRHRVVGKAISAKVLRVGIEHHVIGTRWHEEAIIGIAACGREVKYEHEIATHEAEHLVAIVVPNLHNRSILEVFHTLNDLEHLTIEVTKPVIAEIFVVDEAPLTTGIFVTPAITLTREVDPLRMSELIAHEIEIASIDGTCCHMPR